MGEGDQKIQTSSYAISKADIMYSMENTVGNTVLTLYGDIWYPDTMVISSKCTQM